MKRLGKFRPIDYELPRWPRKRFGGFYRVSGSREDGREGAGGDKGRR